MAMGNREANLFEQVTRLDQLENAWDRVRTNAGCSGTDGMTVEMFGQRAGVRLLGLQRQLREGTYRPQRLRLFDIPKPDGSMRRLAVPAVLDRIAQTAVAQALTPLIDPSLEDVSFAYRRGRSVRQAVQTIRRYREQGFEWVVEGDIERYFDRIPHQPLLEKVEQRLLGAAGADAVVDLISLWLEAGSMSLDNSGVGIPQGSPLSPLLSNLYLDTIDEYFVASHAQLRLVRFADDFVILTRGQEKAVQALEEMRRLLDAHGLGLNAEKTRIVSFDHGFRFLGHLFVRSIIMPSPKSAEEDGSGVETGEQLLRWIAGKDAEQAAAESKLAAERAAGLEPGLRVLYILEPGRVLSLRNQAFTVVQQGLGGRDQAFTGRQELIAIPFRRVDRIEIGPACAADDEAVRHALANDTIIHYVSASGETIGVLAPPTTEHAGLHLAQARTVLNDDARVDLARRIVEGRLRNQRALLHRLNRRRQNANLVQPLAKLNRIIRRLAVANDVPALLGHEGAATALYWPALALMVQADWALAMRSRFKRQRRPAADAFNVVLNYLAALLGRDLLVLAQRHGLHPGYGALHSASDGEHACIYDLMEEFRAPLAEGLAIYLFNNRILHEDMFATPVEDTIRLGREGHPPLIRGYEGWLDREIKSPRTKKRIQWRRLMEEQIVAYARHCRGEELYQPYVMDY